MNEGAIMVSRKYYEAKFFSYPDLVFLSDMRKMLGGITERKALDLLHSKEIKSFNIQHRYMIPKICIIDYLLYQGNHPSVESPPKKKTVQKRKPGTGCLRQLNDNLWEGRFAPINSSGQRITRYVYAKTQTECEQKLSMLITDMKKELATGQE